MIDHNLKDVLHLISLNTQGLRNSAKRGRLTYILQQKAQIIFLQETHFSLEIESLVENDFESFNIYNSYGINNSRGCANLILKKP